MCGITRFRLVIGAAVTFLILVTSLFSHRPPNPDFLLVGSENLRSQAAQSLTPSQESSYNESKESSQNLGRPPVAIVSMLYGDNELYERAINTHLRFAERHGYPAYILRKELVNGVWNKLAYLIHILVMEMDKGQAGAPWIMWVDADSAVVNPALPLDIFLPPDDFSDIHLLASKDQNGFNAGMFFIRAHRWSINLLAKAMALEGCNEEVAKGFAEQTALYLLFNESDTRDHILYQPRKWFNTYEFHFAYEGSEGNMFVHFVGLLEDRWIHMEKWLDILEGPEQTHWEVSLEKTNYPQEIEHFWSLLRDSKEVVKQLGEKVSDPLTLPDSIRIAAEHLGTVLWSETDQPDTVRNAIEELRVAISDDKRLATASAAGGELQDDKPGAEDDDSSDWR